MKLQLTNHPRPFTSRLRIGAALLCAAAFGICSGASAATPNIIFILADDLGYTDVACYGSKYYETPNLDRLASQGMRFTDGHTAGPNCQPTRAALLSGQYGPRTGVYTVGGIDRFDWSARPLRPADNVTKLPIEKITIAETLKQAGYATAMFGKWHLGDDNEFHPSKQGFGEAIVSAGKHFNFNTSPKTSYPEGTYLADFLTDKAVDFIKRSKDKPFFLYLPHFGVHSPYEAKKELIEKFKAKPGAGGHSNAVYAAMLYSVDESVGRIMALLDELKIADNTLVIFSSDNGGVGGYAREGLRGGGNATDNAPLRSGKGSLYEGGHRVAYIFRWPGKIKAASTNDLPIISVDLYPTLVEVAQAKKPIDYTLDGRSYLSHLLGKPTREARPPLYWHFPGYLGAGTDDWRTTPVSVIRSGDWKLMEFFEDNRLELYNLRDDLSEKKNLASIFPDKAKELHQQLATWRTEIKAPIPVKNTASKSAPTEKKGGKKKKKKADA